MESGIIIPTLTPMRARINRSTQMLSTKNAPAPERTYNIKPVRARVRVFIKRHSRGYSRLVRIMNSAGRLTMSWMSSGLRPKKLALMTPRAGAMAAPAITVKRLIERMVKSNLLFIDYCIKLKVEVAALPSFAKIFCGGKGTIFCWKKETEKKEEPSKLLFPVTDAISAFVLYTEADPLLGRVMSLNELAVLHGPFLNIIKGGIGCDEFPAHFKAHGIDLLIRQGPTGLPGALPAPGSIAKIGFFSSSCDLKLSTFSNDTGN